MILSRRGHHETTGAAEMNAPLSPNFTAGIIVTDRYCRAPRGGTVIGGKLYKGGQFTPNCLPDDMAALLADAPPAPARVGIAGFTYAIRPLAIHPEIGSVAFAMHKVETDQGYAVHRDIHDEVSC